MPTMPTMDPTAAPTDVSQFAVVPEPVTARMRMFVETETTTTFTAAKQSILKSAISAIYSYSKLSLDPSEITLILGNGNAGERHLMSMEDVIRTHQLAIAESMNIDLSEVEIQVSGTARHLLGGINVEVLMRGDDAAEAEQFEHEARSEFFTSELVAELQRRGMNLRLHLSSVGAEQHVEPQSLAADAPADATPVVQSDTDQLLLVYIFGALTAVAIGVVGVWLYRRSKRELPTIPEEFVGVKSPKKSPTKKMKTHKIFVSDDGKVKIPALTSTLKQPRAAFNLGKKHNQLPSDVRAPKAPRTPVQSFKTSPLETETPTEFNVDVYETESEMGSSPESQSVILEDAEHEMDGGNPKPNSSGPPIWIANTWTSEEAEDRIASSNIES